MSSRLRSTSRSNATATSRPLCARPPPPQGPETSSCSHPRPRATTSSRTSCSAARSSGGWSRSSDEPVHVPGTALPGSAGREPKAARDVKKGQLEQQLLLLVTLALVAFGLVMVYSSTSASAALANGDSSFYLRKQGLYALVGVGFLILACRSDYRTLRHLSPMLVL